MTEAATVLLPAFLLVIFLGILVTLRVVVPGYASESAVAFPQLASLATRYTVVPIAAIACLQVPLLAIWVLLAKVAEAATF